MPNPRWAPDGQEHHWLWHSTTADFSVLALTSALPPLRGWIVCWFEYHFLPEHIAPNLGSHHFIRHMIRIIRPMTESQAGVGLLAWPGASCLSSLHSPLTGSGACSATQHPYLWDGPAVTVSSQPAPSSCCWTRTRKESTAPAVPVAGYLTERGATYLREGYYVCALYTDSDTASFLHQSGTGKATRPRPELCVSGNMSRPDRSQQPASGRVQRSFVLVSQRAARGGCVFRACGDRSYLESLPYPKRAR